MKVLLSYSGSQSMGVAEALRDLLWLVLPSVEAWMASTDIPPGERWRNVLADTLRDTRFAVICLTRENRSSDWLLFEAGAIATGIDTRRVYPLVIDFALEDISGPLNQFQAVKCDKAGITRILKDLNKELGHDQMTDFDLDTMIGRYWDGFNRRIEGDWISWDKYWEKQSLVVDVLRNLLREKTYEADLLVGISNGGLHFADTVLRRVYNNSKPLLGLWANRENESSYFDNYVNNSFFAGNLVNSVITMYGKTSGRFEVLILDDVVGTTKTFRQVMEYLENRFGDMYERCCIRFMFLYTMDVEIPNVLHSHLLTEDNRCRAYFRGAHFDHRTSMSKLPYWKDIRSGGVISKR